MKTSNSNAILKPLWLTEKPHLQDCDGPEAQFGDVNATLFFGSGGYYDNNFEDPNYCLKPKLLINDNLTTAGIISTGSTSMNNCSVILESSLISHFEVCQSQERIIYDDFEFETTIATEFDLVCDQQYKVWMREIFIVLIVIDRGLNDICNNCIFSVDANRCRQVIFPSLNKELLPMS